MIRELSPTDSKNHVSLFKRIGQYFRRLIAAFDRLIDKWAAVDLDEDGDPDW